MKKIFIPIMLLAGFIAFYEQDKAEPNIFIIGAAIAVFMYGMMRLSAKTPSKNPPDNQDHDIQ